MHIQWDCLPEEDKKEEEKKKPSYALCSRLFVRVDSICTVFWAMHTLPSGLWCHDLERVTHATFIQIKPPVVCRAHLMRAQMLTLSHAYASPPHLTYLPNDNSIFLWNGITVAQQSGIHQWNSCILLATFQMTCNRFSMQTIFVLK